MKQRDHRALAYYLRAHFSEQVLLADRRWRLFLMGSVCPDYNPFTYMRGMGKSHGMLGHNLPYSEEYIQKQLIKLQRKGVHSAWDFFRLGRLMHYLADSFTYPHTLSKGIPMELHRAYEWRLHRLMKLLLRNGERREWLLPTTQDKDLVAFLRRQRNVYESMEKSVKSDCVRIILVCSTVFASLCKIK